MLPQNLTDDNFLKFFDFNAISSRVNALDAIMRFSLAKTMFYRSSVYEHSLRVYYLTKELCVYAEKYLDNFDTKKALSLALVHDDAEMITGDVQLADKLKMSDKELADVNADEEKAIDILAAKYPKMIGNYVYKDLLLHALHKDCPEAEIVSFCDKLDGLCESVHSSLAGNDDLFCCVETYTTLFPSLLEKFSSIKTLRPHLPLHFSNFVFTKDDVKAKAHSLHTRETLLLDSGFNSYDFWKKIILEYLGEDILLVPREVL